MSKKVMADRKTVKAHIPGGTWAASSFRSALRMAASPERRYFGDFLLDI
jgi:hypothetical protein